MLSIYLPLFRDASEETKQKLEKAVVSIGFQATAYALVNEPEENQKIFYEALPSGIAIVLRGTIDNIQSKPAGNQEYIDKLDEELRQLLFKK